MGEDTKKEKPLQAVNPSLSHSTAAPGRAPLAPPPAQRSPRAALEEIFQTHHSTVLKAAYRITGNATDAEDVLQTVFLRLMRMEQTPGPVEELAPYLHRAAVNAALDTLRSRRRSRAVPMFEGDDPAATDPRPSPYKEQQGREMRDGLRRAMAGLSPRAAEVFALRFIEGYGNKEIAGMLGTSQTAIGVSLHRTRAQLRDELGSFLGEQS
jgi:RNA polymerase sigma-70 factor (ECF subfamily)